MRGSRAGCGGGGLRCVAAACVLAAGPFPSAVAEDWPTYRHDVARTGTTPEALKTPLVERWRFVPRVAPDPAWETPREVPVEGILELGRARFDDAHHVAVAAGRVYFGTSGDGRVCALDAGTGQMAWSRYAGGPVRLAPSFAGGRLYFGADDGIVRCLDATTGADVWERRVGPRDERLLGHGKMISRWPVRTGVLVDGGVAYFGAGIFPGEGVFIEAVDAADGRPVWRNDTCGEAPESIISPQGYLLASKGQLYAPLGRVSPAAFDRESGKYMQAATFGKTIGGGSALIANDQLFTGTEEIIAYRAGKKEKTAWLGGRQLVVQGDVLYLATDKAVVALDRKGYGAPSVKRFALREQIREFGIDFRAAETGEAKLAKALAADQKSLAAMAPNAAGRVELERGIQEAGRRLEDARRELERLRERREDLNAAFDQAGEAMSAAQKWVLERACPDAMILAGGTLVGGGDGRVVAIDAASGKVIWEGAFEGRARGLAAADGHLFVSTTTGAIHCFGPEGSRASGIVKDAPPKARDGVDAAWAKACAEAAELIIRESGVTRGYALIVGCGTGRLAAELAKRTELTLCAVDSDASRVEGARALLASEGLLGSRVSVDRAEPGALPFSDYFANLIVSERLLGGDAGCLDAGEVARVLKPCGGVVMLGERAPKGGGAIRALPADKFPGAKALAGGAWSIFRRGALPGAGDWTHAYADAGNTAGGADAALRCPIGLLWFGRPGPLEMISRHRRAAGPLCAGGVMLVQSEDAVTGYDAYNGVRLWRRDLPKVVRELVSHDCSNLASDGKSFLVAHEGECLRLDPRDGKTLATFRVPGEGAQRWGYVATEGGLLFGSATAAGRTCERLFAIDLSTGATLWQYKGPGIPHPSISLADGRVFFVEDRAAASEERRAALHDRLDGVRPKEAEKSMKGTALRFAVCLGARDGKTLWERPVDLTGGIGGLYWSSLGTMAARGTLVIFGVYTDGHYWKDFFAGQFESRRVVALDARGGQTLWDKKIGYRVRPLIVGDTLHAEPWAYDLRTGKQRERINPVTGYAESWQFPRPGHHCGPPAAAQNVMFFRSGHIGYWDLEKDIGTMHFSGQRMGCWINFIVAGGLAMIPEASSGCMCPFPNMCTVVFSPRSRERAWAKTSLVGGVLPVKRLALNLGAPGDRRSANGTLWLGYPRPTGSLVLGLEATVTAYPGGAPFARSPDFSPVDGTPDPWLFASGHHGLRRLEIPLLGPADGKAEYAVRLHFAEVDGASPGERVFDIALQGKTVATGFDPASAAGGAGRAVVKEFTAVPVDGNLAIELVSKARSPGPRAAPTLQAVEIIRERVVALGIGLPPVLLNDARPAAEIRVALANHKDAAFEGSLELGAPEGFVVTPPRSDVRLAANGGKASVAARIEGPRGRPPSSHELVARLVRRDGAAAAEGRGPLDYLGARGRVLVTACEDASVSAASASAKGNALALMVDGGNQSMADEAHSVAYLKFRPEVPGAVRAAWLVIQNAGNPTSGGGQIRLVEGHWSEQGLTYAKRPKLGPVIGKIGKVESREALRIPLELKFDASKEVSLAIDPANTDGVDYTSREGNSPPRLEIEYGE
ncbi:MAG: PQQ-binding-like beta-propeller repeat protein [Verrucomicrobiae bacterium]|nr:PQQ-binding-like beta-propeller repeat protein [Verrucomicrobiae bacterium]